MTGPGNVTGLRRRISILGTIAALFGAVALPALADEPPVTVELNRLEERGADCRAYLLLDNRAKAGFDVFKLDLVIFDRGGVIARRLALDIGPMRAEKKSVKVFDLSGLACPDVSSILVNDVIDCGGKDRDCVGMMQVESRGDVKLTK